MLKYSLWIYVQTPVCLSLVPPQMALFWKGQQANMAFWKINTCQSHGRRPLSGRGSYSKESTLLESRQAQPSTQILLPNSRTARSHWTEVVWLGVGQWQRHMLSELRLTHKCARTCFQCWSNFTVCICSPVKIALNHTNVALLVFWKHDVIPEVA